MEKLGYLGVHTVVLGKKYSEQKCGTEGVSPGGLQLYLSLSEVTFQVGGGLLLGKGDLSLCSCGFA